jgi:hypothetical protein
VGFLPRCMSPDLALLDMQGSRRVSADGGEADGTARCRDVAVLPWADIAGSPKLI